MANISSQNQFDSLVLWDRHGLSKDRSARVWLLKSHWKVHRPRCSERYRSGVSPKVSLSKGETPFTQFCWNGGITWFCTAPLIYQQHMNNLSERLDRVGLDKSSGRSSLASYMICILASKHKCITWWSDQICVHETSMKKCWMPYIAQDERGLDEFLQESCNIHGQYSIPKLQKWYNKWRMKSSYTSYTLHLFIQVGAEIQLPVLEVPAMIRPKHFGSLRGWSQKIGWTWEGSWHGWLAAIWYWLVQLIILGGTFKESKARLKELSTLWLHSKHSSVYMLWRNPCFLNWHQCWLLLPHLV